MFMKKAKVLKALSKNLHCFQAYGLVAEINYKTISEAA